MTLFAPCGPVLATGAAERIGESLRGAADAEGWRAILDAAWPGLEPVFAASPYLSSLARGSPELVRRLLRDGPNARLSDILARAADMTGGAEAVREPLRRMKAEVHLLTALADLGGVWTLDQVTSALSRFADLSAAAALAAVAHDLRESGKLSAAIGDPRGPIPGFFGLAMGKLGAGELNYSSDIDVSLFWEPAVLETALAPDVEPQKFVDRVAHAFSGLMQARTGAGYVFRVDLRLRPDPSSTPPVVPVPFALSYYESVGQNWERAAFIKARPMIGDLAAAEAFLEALIPFVWRRSLDYPAILDIQSIKRQIHVHKTGEGMTAAGANLKLGRGGIREIEFFAQTQQLILGGRDPLLRSRRTVDALAALRDAGHVEAEVCAALTQAYIALRGLEHRVQMLEDEQTHVLPEDDARRAAVAALAGHRELAAFDAAIEARLVEVNRLYGRLFEGEEALSSPYGSLVFTGVENDPETLLTLARMGFTDPLTVADTIRSWHHGRVPATRAARGRELFTRLAPRLLTALADVAGGQGDAADAGFRRFAVFFSGLSAGVQVQSLFLAQPRLFELLVGVMAFAPRLARALGRRPAALDSMLDARFARDIDEDSGVLAQMLAEVGAAEDFEAAMNVVRRVNREQMFRIGVQTLSGRAGPEAAGRAYTLLADACLSALAPAALAEVSRQAGSLAGGHIAVVALGKAGSREMTASSDLDLLTIYEAPVEAMSDGKGWPASTFYSRFTQRLITALSAHTAEGGLYEVDMRLRPGGTKGPVSLSLEAIETYYAEEADTWEFMAMTRARVAWANDPAFASRVTDRLQAILRRRRPEADVHGDAWRMRELMRRERPAHGVWDLKLAPGGQVDAEFVAQVRQLNAAAAGGPLTVSTLEALGDDPDLAEAWRLQQALAQVLSAAFDERPDPATEPEGFRRRLAEAVGYPDFAALETALTEVRARARAAFDEVLPPVATDI